MIEPVDTTTFTTCMEQLQEGYVATVAAAAGCTMEFVRRDIYGIDVRLIRPRGVDAEEIRVDAQLKNSTRVKPNPGASHFSFQFKERSHMAHLTKPRGQAKAILVVMATTGSQKAWTETSHDQHIVRHCCYWMNLEGHEIKDGVKSPSVRVPTANIFDAEALTMILDKLERGEPL
ncbi:hypothetical protein ABIA35_009579 [Catenulispora sp. MAP12-49]|uniref:DUF4365 domain-containing protein n=1 Tax=Catenulispora sp. MAP12-49 TaxID=3156302 RepID=UPI003517C12D